MLLKFTWPKWVYIGTVSARSVHVDRHGVYIPGRADYGSWVLMEHKWFGRKYIANGNPGNSPYSQRVKASVFAWEKGGPLPCLDEGGKVQKSSPVIRLVREE